MRLYKIYYKAWSQLKEPWIYVVAKNMNTVVDVYNKKSYSDEKELIKIEFVPEAVEVIDDKTGIRS